MIIIWMQYTLTCHIGNAVIYVLSYIVVLSLINSFNNSTKLNIKIGFLILIDMFNSRICLD